MMLEEIIIHSLEKAVNAVYGVEPQKEMLQVQATRKEFEGDLTAVMFPLLKLSRKSPEQTGQAIGEWMLANESRIESFQVIKGFLNLKMSSEYWKDQLREIERSREYGFASDSGKTIVIEFSSPNTNKPLHLGHVRNNLLGWSVSRLMEANGHKVIRVNLVNDRGIHICKSM
ncbi:MAG TPA: arginine--tRNA ligase, partial [Bacteroidales bacterium]|nr:arginine--tRNA ligase [Bacteroidales bacterium]